VIENDTFLQQCKTLEADFNALNTYLEKRTFTIEFHTDFNANEAAKELLNEFYLFNKSKPSFIVPPHHNSKNVLEFSNKLTGNRKIKFDAYYRVLELLENEFEKIRPAIICELTANIIIGLYEYDINNKYGELIYFSNLLESKVTQKNASKLFYKKCNGKDNVTYCWQNCLRDIREKYSLNYIGINREKIRSGLLNKDFIEKNKINYKDLAAKIKEHTNKILNIESTPSAHAKPPTNEMELTKSLKTVQLLQRCETLETDFNACNTFDEKRDFVIQFFNDVQPNFNKLYCNWYSTRYSTDCIEYDKKEVFLNDTPEFKIMQDACNLAKELFRKEFKKKEPEILIEIAVEVCKEIYKNDHIKLGNFANYLIDYKELAHEKFYEKTVSIIYSEKTKVLDSHRPPKKLCKNTDLFDVDYWLYLIDSIKDGLFFTTYNIDNNALAAKVKEYNNKFLPTPPPNPKPPILQRWKNALYEADKNNKIACLFIESGLYQELIEKQHKKGNENLLNPGPLAKEMCKYIFKNNIPTYKTLLSSINKDTKNNPLNEENKLKAKELISKHQLQKIKLDDIIPSKNTM